MADVLAPLRDPNLRFPARPCLVADLKVFAMPDGLGLQIRGAERPVVLRGRRVGAAVDYLLPRLDGSSSAEELLTGLPPDLTAELVVQALSLLHSKGLLSDPEPALPAGHDPVLERQHLFWGRQLDITRSARTAAEVQRRIGAARLTLVGTGLFGVAVYDLLTRSGCHDVLVIDWNDEGLLLDSVSDSPVPPRAAVHLPTTSVDAAAAHVRRGAEASDLVVTATCEAPAALFRAINRISIARRLPWIRANATGSLVEIGPYVTPGESACFACLELREASMQDLAIEEGLYQDHLAEERDAADRVPRGEAVWSAALAAGVLVAEVVRLMTGIAPPTLLGSVVQLSPVVGSFRTNTFLRVPRCPECYRGQVPSHPATSAVGR